MVWKPLTALLKTHSIHTVYKLWKKKIIGKGADTIHLTVTKVLFRCVFSGSSLDIVNYVRHKWHKTNKIWLKWGFECSCWSTTMWVCVCVFVSCSIENNFHFEAILCYFMMYFQWSLVLTLQTNGFVIWNLIVDISCDVHHVIDGIFCVFCLKMDLAGVFSSRAK